MSTPEQTVLVTGGGRGIGAATALRCAARGWAVLVDYHRDGAAAEALAGRIRAGGGLALAMQADVADENDVLRLFARLDDALPPLGGLVNNAGIVAAPERLDEMSRARIERMLAVNVVGSMLCAREAVRRMSSRHGGSGGAIVNVSSAAARLGGPGQYVDYAASKGAIDTLTLGLAREVAGEGIRVNAVRPGVIETEIHASGGQPDRAARLAPTIPLRRSGTADEVAATIAWLLSDEASYVTGAVLDVAGGR